MMDPSYELDAPEWPACQLCPSTPFSPAEYVTLDLDNLCARCCQESGRKVLYWIGDCNETQAEI